MWAHPVFQIVCTSISRNVVTLKIQVMVTIIRIHNGAIRLLVSIYVKVVRDNFSLALTDFQKLHIYIFLESLLPLHYRSRSRYTTFAVLPFDGKYTTSYLLAIIFAHSLIVYDTFTTYETRQLFTMKMKIEVEEWKNWT